MAQGKWYLSLHWIARSFAVLIAGFVFLFFFGEGVRPTGTYTLNPSQLKLGEGLALALVLGSAAAMLCAWIWEKWAGTLDVVLAAAFLGCCLFMPGMHRVWFFGVALMLPGLLYLAAAAIRTPGHALSR